MRHDKCRRIPEQLAEAAASVDSLMADEFLRVTAFNSFDGTTDAILARLVTIARSSDSLVDTALTLSGDNADGPADSPTTSHKEGGLASNGHRGSTLARDGQLLRILEEDEEGRRTGFSEDLLDELQPLVINLRRTGRMSGALQAMRDTSALQVKHGIRCDAVPYPRPSMF